MNVSRCSGREIVTPRWIFLELSEALKISTLCLCGDVIRETKDTLAAPLLNEQRTTKENIKMKKQTKKPQTKLPVDREAVRVSAVELGAREAARRLDLNPNTVLSWAKRDNWKLPYRKGGATKASASAITLQSKPGDVLIATHEERGSRTKTALARVVAASAEQAADQPLPVQSVTALRDLVQARAKLFGWDVRSAWPIGECEWG